MGRRQRGRDRRRAISNSATGRRRRIATGVGSADILVWPESALPFLLTDRPEVLAAIADLLAEGHDADHRRRPRRTQPGGGDELPRVFNSVYVIADDGEIVDAYDKVHLVPFGEYLPFAACLDAPRPRQLVALPGGFAPGSRHADAGARAARRPFAPLICYEIIFPGEAVAAGPRPGWLLNVTNDAWFGDTPGPLPAFSAGPGARGGGGAAAGSRREFRHFRDRRRLWAGRSTALASAWPGSSTVHLPEALPPTLYARFGDWIFLVLLLLCGWRSRLHAIYRLG